MLMSISSAMQCKWKIISRQDNIGRQKECEAKGKYVEAEAFKRKVKELKEELQDCQMFEYKTKH